MAFVWRPPELLLQTCRSSSERRLQQDLCFNCRMRELLLAAALLHSVIAEFEGEKSYRSESNIESQSWPPKLRRLPWNNIDHNFLPTTIIANRSEIDPIDSPLIRLRNLQDLRKVTRYRSSIVQKQPIVIIMHEYQESIDDRSGADRIRRQNQGWTLQEPFYVEEPSWISIEENGKSFGKASDENDPFFVTRGKKVLSLEENRIAQGDKTGYYDIVKGPRNLQDTSNEDERVLKILGKGSEGSWSPEVNVLFGEFNENQKYPDPLESILKDLEKSLYQENFKISKILMTKAKAKQEYPTSPAGNSQDDGIESMRKYRRRRSANFEKKISKDSKDVSVDKKDFEKRANYKAENDELRENIRNAILQQGHAADFQDLSFLQPRNKHSSILDIFDEPFFISRGKKNLPNFSQVRGTVPDQDLSVKDTVDPATKKFSPVTSSCEYLSRIFENWQFCQDSRDKRSKVKTPRNRRGMLDEILMRYDPFYVARGKRITSGFLEKAKKNTSTDAIKFLEDIEDNWSNARNDLQAWKEFQRTSSAMKNNRFEDNVIRNTANLNIPSPSIANNNQV